MVQKSFWSSGFYFERQFYLLTLDKFISLKKIKITCTQGMVTEMDIHTYIEIRSKISFITLRWSLAIIINRNNHYWHAIKQQQFAFSIYYSLIAHVQMSVMLKCVHRWENSPNLAVSCWVSWTYQCFTNNYLLLPLQFVTQDNAKKAIRSLISDFCKAWRGSFHKYLGWT